MRVHLSTLFLFVALHAGSEASAQSIGLVTDLSTHRAVLFDADSYQSLGSVALPTPFDACFGDCVISPDQQTAYVSRFTGGIFVIDLSTRPPTAASGTNPIPTTYLANDLDLTPDGLFLVACGQSLMTVDTVLRVETANYEGLGSLGSVDASRPGYVVAGKPNGLSLHRFLLASDGSVTNTLEQINVLESTDTELAPGHNTGVAVSSGTARMRSFLSAPLTLVDTRILDENALSVTVHPQGRRVFLRLNSGVEAYTFDPVTAQLGAEPLYRVVIPHRTTCFPDSIVVHPDGTRLFVPVDEQILVLDVNDGHFLGRITDPAIVNPWGVSIRAGTGAF